MKPGRPGGRSQAAAVMGVCGPEPCTIARTLPSGDGAVARLREGGEPEVTAWSFAVMMLTLAINLMVVRYERRQGHQLSSELLLADATHTQSDVLTSCVVIASTCACSSPGRAPAENPR